MEALDRSKDIAVSFRSALRHGDISDCGELLAESWEYKKKFSNAITNPDIDNLYNAAKRAGAIGGKVSGAGGGGFMYFICEFDKKLAVSKALAEAGATPSEFMFEPNGVTSWKGEFRSDAERSFWTGTTPSVLTSPTTGTRRRCTCIRSRHGRYGGSTIVGTSSSSSPTSPA